MKGGEAGEKERKGREEGEREERRGICAPTEIFTSPLRPPLNGPVWLCNADTDVEGRPLTVNADLANRGFDSKPTCVEVYDCLCVCVACMIIGAFYDRRQRRCCILEKQQQ